ncbi:MAG: DUF2232 domain-containing protein, partial [Desulfobulbus sp.]|nr:DUF2232 domain-containing protein [Desulfobulbus sp.]
MADSQPGRQQLPLHPGQTFLCSVLFFLPALIPSLFGWLNGFLAVPVVYLLSSRGAQAGTVQLLISLMAACLAALFIGRIEGFFFSLTLVPLGYSLYRSAQAGDSPAVSGAKGGLVLLGVWLLFWSLQGQASGVDPYTHLRESLDAGFRQMLEFATSEEAGLSPEMVYSIQQTIGEIRETAPRLLPGLLATLVPVTVWLSMVTVNGLTGRYRQAGPLWQRYATWTLPEQLVWAPIAAAGLLLISNGTVHDFSMWVLLITGTLFFFQ